MQVAHAKINWGGEGGCGGEKEKTLSRIAREMEAIASEVRSTTLSQSLFHFWNHPLSW